MAKSPTLTFRLTADQREHLNTAAAAAGLKPSEYLRHLLDVDRGEGSLDDLSPIATREEVLTVLSRAARRGNLKACELMLKHAGAPAGAGGQPEKPQSALDQLAAKRAAKSA